MSKPSTAGSRCDPNPAPAPSSGSSSPSRQPSCAASSSRPAARASRCRSIECCFPKPMQPARLRHAEGRRVIRVDGHADSGPCADRNSRTEPGTETNGPLVVLADSSRRHAFQVDRLIGQRDVVIKALNPLLPHLPAVAGASVEPDGSILLVLDPPGLIQRASSEPVVSERSTTPAEPPADEPPKHPGGRRRPHHPRTAAGILDGPASTSGSPPTASTLCPAWPRQPAISCSPTSRCRTWTASR